MADSRHGQGRHAAGALSEKHKELIALAISVSQRCAAASASMSSAARLGASRAEFEEVLAWRSTWRRPGAMYAAERCRPDQFNPPEAPRATAHAAGAARRSQDCGSSVASTGRPAGSLEVHRVAASMAWRLATEAQPSPRSGLLLGAQGSASRWLRVCSAWRG